jgi:hypothetical protein
MRDLVTSDHEPCFGNRTFGMMLGAAIVPGDGVDWGGLHR